MAKKDELTKRQELTLLLDKGCHLDSYEIRRLGLAKSTIRKYYRDWATGQGSPAAQAPVPISSLLTPISSLRPQRLFELDHQTWRLRRLEVTRAYILLVEKAQGANYTIEKQGKYIPLNTMVKAI